MAKIIHCKACNNGVSTKAKNCPQCGEPMRRTPFLVKFFAVIFILPFVMMISYLLIADPEAFAPSHSGQATAAKPRVFDHGLAQVTCKQAIRRASRDPEQADIPFVRGAESGTISQFVWNQNSKMLRLQNGLGNPIAVTGLCEVDRSTERITKLVIDGDKLI